MEREPIHRDELAHLLQEAEIGNQSFGSTSRRHSLKHSERGSDNWKGGISKELWKAFLIEEEFSTGKLSAPKFSVDDDLSSSSDDQEADEIENDECSDISDGSVDQPLLHEAVERDKHLLNTFIAYESAMSPSGKVDHEQIEACKKLIGKSLNHNVGNLEYKDYDSWKNEIAKQKEEGWSLLSRAMSFATGRIPCIPWPVYNHTDPRLMHDRSMRYGMEMRCQYPKWNMAQNSKF
ncbi:unnamed protein product [Orchesella dallaii]|uniref:Uncharacterized protein n=1 Tax=Orchesella dallaii TaxID=48710 RepID=A0ABP1RB89_9HEXA